MGFSDLPTKKEMESANLKIIGQPKVQIEGEKCDPRTKIVDTEFSNEWSKKQRTSDKIEEMKFQPKDEKRFGADIKLTSEIQ